MYRPFKPFPSVLYPSADPETGQVEQMETYLARLALACPNIPGQVARQVFFDHGHFIDRWSWLDFHKLSFSLREWKIKAIGASGLLQHSVVRYFACESWGKHPTARKQRLEAYFRQRGTWPVPPVLIRISKALGHVPPWVEKSGPWVLIEGHYRMGLLLRWHDQFPESRLHKVWIGEPLEG